MHDLSATSDDYVKRLPRMHLNREMRESMAEALSGKRTTVSHTSRRHPLAAPVEYKLNASHMVLRLLDEERVYRPLMEALRESDCPLVARLRMAIIDAFPEVMGDELEAARAAKGLA